MKPRPLVLMGSALLAHMVFNLAPSYSPKQESRPRFSQFEPDLSSKWFLPAGAVIKEGVPFDTYILIANPGIQTGAATVYFRGSSTSIDETNLSVGPYSRRTVKIGDFVAQTHPESGAVSTMVDSNVPVMCERAMYFPGGAGWTAWTGGHGTIGINDPSDEWNLPEGATHLFDQYIHVFNPGAAGVTATATFMNEGGFAGQTSAWLEGERNWTIYVNEVVGYQSQVSTKVTSTAGPVAVDRTMYWPVGGPSVWRGGHSSRGISSPSTIWYLAEGANHQFDHYVLVSNPSTTHAANLLFTFMDKNGAFTNQTYGLPPQSRYTVKVNEIPGWGDKDQVSTMVQSTNAVPIFAERAMYWPKGGPSVWRGGHNSIASTGLPEAALRWQLPEGANHIFDHYILVANPSETRTVEVIFTFMDQNGVAAIHFHSVEPKSRYTLKVNDIPGLGNKTQVSTTVEAEYPILVERTMYWPKGGPSVWVDGHATVGIAE